MDQSKVVNISICASMAPTSDRRAGRQSGQLWALEDALCVSLGPENEVNVNRD